MPDTYDPAQPHDDHGRWSKTASEHGYVVKDFEAKMAKVIAGNTQVGESRQCVALVKHLAPEVGRAADWQEGPAIRSFGDPPLERGTPIATFKDGRYPNAPSGNHAAVFIEYGTKGLAPGIWVLDQAKDLDPQKRFIQLGGRAERYSVIKRK